MEETVVQREPKTPHFADNLSLAGHREHKKHSDFGERVLKYLMLKYLLLPVFQHFRVLL